MMELQEIQTTRYIIENAQKIIKNMFGKGLISFLSLYLSINIEIDHCVTVIEDTTLHYCFYSFSCYCQKYLKGHAMPFIIDFCTH